jgi:hypothetical protein
LEICVADIWIGGVTTTAQIEIRAIARSKFEMIREEKAPPFSPSSNVLKQRGFFVQLYCMALP